MILREYIQIMGKDTTDLLFPKPDKEKRFMIHFNKT